MVGEMLGSRKVQLLSFMRCLEYDVAVSIEVRGEDRKRTNSVSDWFLDTEFCQVLFYLNVLSIKVTEPYWLQVVVG